MFNVGVPVDIGRSYIGNNVPAPTGGARAVYFSASAAVLYDNQGNVYGAIESIRDITYHKKAEEQKRKAEKDLKGC